MNYYHYRKFFIATFILLSMTSLGLSAQYKNQSVLVNSKIKNNAFGKIFKDIKKTLPRNLRRCSMIVKDIDLVKIESGASMEDWVINICRETRIYCVQAYWLKGSYFVSVKPKNEVLARQRSIWNTAKESGNEDLWEDSLFYIDEIKAME